MTAEEENAAGVARGRRIIRIARGFLLGSAIWMVLFIGGGVLAVQFGWLADDDATPALIGLAAAFVGMVVFFILNRRGTRLVGASIQGVVDAPGAAIPECLQIGIARPKAVTPVLATVFVAALVLLPFLQPTGGMWAWPEAVAAFTLAVLVWSGPGALSLESAYLDATGIRLPLLGIHAPWESINAVRAVNAYQLEVAISGPLQPAGDQPARWTRRAIARYQPGKSLKITTGRPEVAVRVASRYLHAR